MNDSMPGLNRNLLNKRMQNLTHNLGQILAIHHHDLARVPFHRNLALEAFIASESGNRGVEQHGLSCSLQGSSKTEASADKCVVNRLYDLTLPGNL